MRRHVWDIVAIALVIAVGVFALLPEGVKAIVRNADAETMRDVQVVVTGRSYPLGDIPPNETRSVHVKPTGESNIRIRYTDVSGTSKTVAVDCPIEAGTAGSISVDVANGAVAQLTDNTEAPL
jgi:hypothetical protein